MSPFESDSDSCESDADIDEGCTENYKCLLCNNNSSLIPEFFEHLSSAHQWNLGEEKRLFEDQFLWITFVNWARKTKPERFSDFYKLSGEQRMSFTHPHIEDDDVLMIGKFFYYFPLPTCFKMLKPFWIVLLRRIIKIWKKF